MEQQELKTLKIIEAIEKDNSQSQRELAKRLGISLGLVNSLLKKIVQKGYFKVTTIPKNRIRLILTPKGFSEKISLTYRYLTHAVNYYTELREKLCSIVQRIDEENQKTIVIYGANELTEIICLILKEYELELLSIVDDEKAGQKMFGMTIADSSFLDKNSFDAVIVTQMNSNREAMMPILECSVRENRIYRIY